jgi:isoleucyl-tRNA synthetase
MMYRNLRTSTEPDSVHLCDYPQADKSLIDEELSDDMEALLNLVSLGSAARNSVKIKVRQPLAELKVLPASDGERRAVARFADQIRDELNIKKVTHHEPSAGPLLTAEIKPNPKALGPKFGQRLKQLQAAVAAMPIAELAAKVNAGQPFELQGDGGPFALEPTDFFVTMKAPEGWAGFADRGTEVLLDVRLTDALRLEGLARDVIRQVQDQRKEAELEPEDRITLYLATESTVLRQAIEAHRDYIAGETLIVTWSTEPLKGQVHRAEVTVDGQPLTIELMKASVEF